MALTPQELEKALSLGRAEAVLQVPPSDGEDDPAWRWNRCRAHIALKQFPRAVAEGEVAWRHRQAASLDLQALICLDFSHALGMSGDYPRAAAVAAEGLLAGSDGREISLRENLGHWLCMSGDVSEGLAHLRQATALSLIRGATFEWARLSYLVGRWTLEAGHPALASDILASARPTLEGRGGRFAGWAQVYHGRALLALDDSDQAWQLGRRALVECRDDHPEVAAAALCLLSAVATALGRYQEAAELAVGAQTLALSLGRDDIYREATALLMAARR